MTFKPFFGPITKLSLYLVNSRVPRFQVSHLTHETFKLGLQNTLNMSKTARVYFGALHCLIVLTFVGEGSLEIKSIFTLSTSIHFSEIICPSTIP